MDRPTSTARALTRYALVVAGCIAAASLWATARPETGLLLDAYSWRLEATAAQGGAGPTEGWYRLVASDAGVEVRPAAVRDTNEVPEDALFFRLPGTALKPGWHPAHRHLDVLRTIRLGRDHEMLLSGRRFSLRVDEVDDGMRYTVGYGGATYTYVLGAGGASRVRAMADLDGDRRPDFLVDVEDQATYLLLSTRALPGANLPTAELPLHDGC